MNPVTLQINVTADDLKHCKYLLPHQLELFDSQVDEVILTYDKQPQKVVNNEELAKNQKLFEKFLSNVRTQSAKVEVHEIDYSKETIKEITNRYYNRTMPTHDFRGAPVYGYLYGIEQAKNDFVFHLDSDMFFGGMSKTWIEEAIELMRKDEKILSVSPLPGPPHPDNLLKGQSGYKIYGTSKYSFEFNQMSTRICMFDRTRLHKRLFKLNPGLKKTLFSKVFGFAAVETLELTISDLMSREGYKRVDFMGEEPGLWSVHPLLRSDEFYRKIPEMIDRVVRNDVPVSQLGDYNFSDDFIDWSDAKENFEHNRLRNKLLRKVGLKK